MRFKVKHLEVRIILSYRKMNMFLCTLYLHFIYANNQAIESKREKGLFIK